MEFLTHETLYRSKEIVDKRCRARIGILGLGALGSNLVPLLVRNGFKSILGIDCDRIDRHNPANQFYTLMDVGRKKTAVLKNRIYRELGVDIDVCDREIEHVNAKIFESCDLLVDTFDNWPARTVACAIAHEINKPLVHVGMSISGFSEIKWDEHYKIPEIEEEQEDVCEYPLSCNLVYLTTAMTAEIVCAFVDSNAKNNLSFTINDMHVEII